GKRGVLPRAIRDRSVSACEPAFWSERSLTGRGAGGSQADPAPAAACPSPQAGIEGRPGRSRRPMATASRSRAPAGAKSRPRAPLAAMAAADAARSWGVPALALAVIAPLVVLSAAGALGTAGTLARPVAAAPVP